MITYAEFEKVNLCSGTIIKVAEFPRAKKPAFKVWADFGAELGVLQTSAQITVHYKGICYIVDNIKINTKTWGFMRKEQPRFVIKGKCSSFDIINNIGIIN